MDDANVISNVKGLRICPITKAICDEKCAWRYRKNDGTEVCVIAYLIEVLEKLVDDKRYM